MSREGRPIPDRPVLVASNRGPVSFDLDPAGGPVPSRGAGGLSASLDDVLSAVGGRWIATAISEGDRAQAATGPFDAGGYAARLLSFAPDVFDAYYNGIANHVLWFCHHALWDVPTTPVFDAATRAAWAAYGAVNRGFADTLLEEAGADDAAFLVQDYHLCMVPRLVRERRPSARIAHFTHIPFAEPGYLSILPDVVRVDLLEGLLGADVVGFHAPAWAGNFLESCRRLPGARVDARRRTVRWEGRTVRVAVNPISIDAAGLRAQAADASVQARRGALRTGDEHLIVRADRMELSKNLIRGFHAFERLLEGHPEWRGRVRFLAHAYRSREAIPEYARYAEDCLAAADRVNERFAAADWTPVDLVLRDDFDEVLAAYLEYDVLLVNPVFDGMNLVAKEGPAVNDRDGTLVLSRNAGAHRELGRHAYSVNPFDVEETAEALHAALSAPAAERRRRARGLRRAVESRSPRDWADAQLAALG